MANSPNLRVDLDGETVEGFLARMSIDVRNKSAKAAVRAAGTIVKRQAKKNAPVGGSRTGRKADKPHLRDTIKVKVKEYGEYTIAIVGAAWPSGAHAHLVEFGHDIVRGGETVAEVAPQPYLRPAADTTKKQQADAIKKSLAKALERQAKQG
jgi:HK97 gp10 family phage protein